MEASASRTFSGSKLPTLFTAVSVSCTLIYHQRNPGGPGVRSNVGWDDVSLIVDCVDKTAKISGKFAADGKKPTHVFGGAVALLEGDDIAAGSIITISYKKGGSFGSHNVSCDFTPNGGGLTISGGTATLWSGFFRAPPPAPSIRSLVSMPVSEWADVAADPITTHCYSRAI